MLAKQKPQGKRNNTVTWGGGAAGGGGGGGKDWGKGEGWEKAIRLHVLTLQTWRSMKANIPVKQQPYGAN